MAFFGREEVFKDQNYACSVNPSMRCELQRAYLGYDIDWRVAYWLLEISVMA